MKTILATVLTLALATTTLAQDVGMKRVYPLSIRDNSILADRGPGYFAAENATDGNPATSWRMNWRGRGSAVLVLEIPSDTPMVGIGLDFYNGETRNYAFGVYVISGSQLIEVLWTRSGKRKGPHFYKFWESIPGEYLILSIEDNGLNPPEYGGPPLRDPRRFWGSVNEVKLYAESALLPYALDERR